MLVFIFSCSVNKMEKFDFLIGTWKIENQAQFESWTRAGLAIKRIGDQIVYEATVPDQNQGQTIQFVLNPEIDSSFSFENSNHDFPKSIQYRKISENELIIKVSGDDNNGFNYRMIKQE